AILGSAKRRRGHDIDEPAASASGDRHESLQALECAGPALRSKSAASRHFAPDTAEAAFVEAGHGGAAQPFIDDQTNRIGAGVDDRDGLLIRGGLHAAASRRITPPPPCPPAPGGAGRLCLSVSERCRGRTDWGWS